MPRAAVVAACVWLALVSAAVGVESWTGRPAPTCVFKHVTGCPCLTCGGTRAGMSLVHGDLFSALAWNPLVAGLLVFGPMWLTARWAMSRDREGTRRYLSPRGRATAWMIGVAAVGANWVYVIWHGN